LHRTSRGYLVVRAESPKLRTFRRESVLWEGWAFVAGAEGFFRASPFAQEGAAERSRSLGEYGVVALAVRGEEPWRGVDDVLDVAGKVTLVGGPAVPYTLMKEQSVARLAADDVLDGQRIGPFRKRNPRV